MTVTSHGGPALSADGGGAVVAATVIGRGPVAIVYSGRLADTGAEVAVKVFPDRFDRDTASRLDRERRALAAAGPVPSILTVDAVREYGGDRSSVITQLCAGSLAGMLTRGALPVSEVLGIGAAVAGALAAAHEAGVVHGGVTPHNVLFRRSGEPVLGDFGLALRERFSRDPMHALEYTAPETLRDDTRSASSDLYGLGAVLYAMLTGAPPFPRRTGQAPGERILRVLRDPVPPIQAIPGELSELVSLLLAKDPAARPTDATRVAAWFNHARGSRSTAVPPALHPLLPPAPHPDTDFDSFAGRPDLGQHAPMPQHPMQPPFGQPRMPQPPAAPPVTQQPATQPPPAPRLAAQPPLAQPPGAQPPATQPPLASRPATQSATTQPPLGQTPSTQPPATQSPLAPRSAAQSPATQPPVAPTPDAQPPAAPAPLAEPPAAQTPVTQAPAAQPSLAQPPLAQPTDTQTSVAPTPDTQTPLPQPPAAQPPATHSPLAEPADSQPSAAESPGTPTRLAQPPDSQTPVAQPRAAQATDAQPPGVQATATQSPVAQPPDTQPSAVQTRADQTPLAQPPNTHTPTTQPPLAPPSTSQTPLAQSPGAQGQATQPRLAEPPDTETPLAQPSAAQPPASQTSLGQTPVAQTPGAELPGVPTSFVQPLDTSVPQGFPAAQAFPTPGRTLIYTAGGQEETRRGASGRWKVAAGIGAVVVAAGVVVAVVLSGGDSESGVRQAPPTTIAPSTTESRVVRDVGLVVTTVDDLGDHVELTWEAEGDLDFSVVVAGENIDTMVLVANRAREMRVPVDADRKYCFQIRATDGRDIFTSEPVPIRGARCAL